MPRKRKYTDITVGLAYPEIQKINEIMKIDGCNRSDIIRIALRQFLEAYGKEPQREYENILEARLRKLENRIATLSVLATRASAQALYYMTLPYSRGGFPSRPLKEEAFKSQWEKSRSFAAQFLKNASVIDAPEDREAETKTSSND
ncbi:MAG: hypothetical protein SFY67_12025 [Candidatus Melainabacteria bacterium]|nr:hypothetical protein [Candidatus Melainabacteria bacterium]